MIVAIGSLQGRLSEAGQAKPAGFLATLVMAAAEGGADVQVVARIGDDDIGDAILLALGAAGVGHVATFRDAGLRTPLITDDHEVLTGDPEPPRDATSAGDGTTLEAADVGLALRYLTDYRVIVVAHGVDPDIVREASEAATWAGAHLVIVTPPDVELGPRTPDDALVLSSLPDAEGIAIRLGEYAAAIDRGTGPDTAYAVLTEATT